MNLEEYYALRNELRDLRDLRKFRYPRGMLFTILAQKKVDLVKYNFHRVAERLEELKEYWERHTKFPPWARLMPVMRVNLLLRALGYTKKTIARVMRNPDMMQEEELRKVIWNAVLRDYVYSPIAVRHQFARGRLGERIIREWLEEKGIEYEDEKALRGKYGKTPDFLLSEPVKINGREVRWIESKALFGDPKTHRFYAKKQYNAYLELFGHGAVVYWFGYVSGLSEDFDILSGEIFNSKHLWSLKDMIVYTTSDENEAERLAEKTKGVVVDISGNERFEIVIPELHPDRCCGQNTNGEFIEGMCRLVDNYSYGRLIILGDRKDWRKCHRARIGMVLKNMGFEVFHL